MTQILLKKMQTIFSSPIKYLLCGEGFSISVNDLIGSKISIEHTGSQCLCCHKEKQIYRQGFCKKCFFESPLAGQWIINPQLSTAHLGIEDRDLEYEIQAQIQPHIVYLAKSGDIKVGVTRLSQTPTRWIDQGASQALPLAKTPNRYLAGVAEVALKKHLPDKTNWRKMLTNDICSDDIVEVKNKIINLLPQEVKPFVIDSPPVCFSYPVEKYPTSVKSLNLNKTPFFSDVLCGVKGQYLLFESSVVFNVRTYEGFKINLNF